LGSQRTVQSLAAEDSALLREWLRGQLPATVLKQEQENISDAASQASDELSQLESSLDG